MSKSETDNADYPACCPETLRWKGVLFKRVSRPFDEGVVFYKDSGAFEDIADAYELRIQFYSANPDSQHEYERVQHWFAKISYEDDCDEFEAVGSSFKEALDSLLQHVASGTERGKTRLAEAQLNLWQEFAWVIQNDRFLKRVE